MVASDNSFRNRATSLLHAANPFRLTLQSTDSSDGNHKNKPTPNAANEKPRKGSDQTPDTNSSEITNEKTAVPSPDEVAAENRDSRRAVRTIPTWVRSPSPHSDSDDEDADAPATQSLLNSPPFSHPAHHNHTPAAPHHNPPSGHLTFPFTTSGPAPGHLHDAQREWTSPIPSHPLSTIGSRWAAFAASSAYPRPSSPAAERVSPEWLLENGPDYSQPWRAHAAADQDPSGQSRRRKAFLSRAQHTILRSPIIPLVIRSIVWLFSLIALCLGAKLLRQQAKFLHDCIQTNVRSQCADVSVPSTSPEMAVVVDAIALVYLVYITYDEYTGKPLGLRNAKSKMRLIFLDLFFIVFDSANLSLAFEALGGYLDKECLAMLDDSCKNQINNISREQKALVTVLFLALVAWLLTFSISVMR